MSKSATVRLGVGAQRERDGLRIGFAFLVRATKFLRDLAEVVRWKRGEGERWSAPGKLPILRKEVRERRTVVNDLAGMVIIQVIVQGSVCNDRKGGTTMAIESKGRNVELGVVAAYSIIAIGANGRTESKLWLGESNPSVNVMLIDDQSTHELSPEAIPFTPGRS